MPPNSSNSHSPFDFAARALESTDPVHDLINNGVAGRSLDEAQIRAVAEAESRIRKFWIDHPDLAIGTRKFLTPSCAARVDPESCDYAPLCTQLPRLGLRLSPGVDGTGVPEFPEVAYAFEPVTELVEAIQLFHRQIIEQALSEHPDVKRTDDPIRTSVVSYYYPKLTWPLPFSGWERWPEPDRAGVRIGEHGDPKASFMTIAGTETAGLHAERVAARGSAAWTLHGGKFGDGFGLSRGGGTKHLVLVPFDSERIVISVVETFELEKRFMPDHSRTPRSSAIHAVGM